MDRQTTLAFVIIGAILILWLYLNSPAPPTDQQPRPKDKDTIEVLKDTAGLPEYKVEKDLIETTKGTESLGRFFEYTEKEDRIITIENDVAVIEISTRGANFRKYFLKEFKNWYSANADSINYKTMVQLINYLEGD